MNEKLEIKHVVIADRHEARILHCTGLMIRELEKIGCPDVAAVFAKYYVSTPEGYDYVIAYPLDCKERIREKEHLDTCDVGCPGEAEA